MPRAVFVRALGLVYLLAFASFWSQAEGLVGSRGILPVADTLEWAREALGPAAWRHLPTVLWLDAGDPALHALCAAGCAAALAAVAGVAPAAALAVSWICYLSVYVAGQQFLSYQWDALLLEAGVLGVMWAPLGLAAPPGLGAGAAASGHLAPALADLPAHVVLGSGEAP